jgi:hypothetical protein
MGRGRGEGGVYFTLFVFRGWILYRDIACIIRGFSSHRSSSFEDFTFEMIMAASVNETFQSTQMR